MQTNCPGVTHRGRISTCLAPLAVLALASAAVAVALAMGVGCGGGMRFATRAPRDSVTVLFSADNQGVLSSCGCATSPSGGFARRQTVIEDYRSMRSNVVVVDAGDMFHDRPNTIKARYLAMAVGRAKYDAVAMGTLDFELGADQVLAFAKEYKIPFICANVRDESGEPVFPPHVIRQAGKMKIGIFAVIADRVYGTPPREWRKGLKVEPPIAAARREVSDLAGCDIIIALSNQPLADSEELARSVPGIRIVISGHDEQVLREPVIVGDGWVVGTGAAGRMLGALTFFRDEAGLPDVSMELDGLSTKVDESGWVVNMYWDYVKKAKNEPPPEWDQMTVPASYQSAEDCMGCHPDEYNEWLTTKHTYAYATLVKERKQDDPECILCHTMGFGREGGFISMEKTPDLGRVTCQACHPVTPPACDSLNKSVKPAGEVEPKVDTSSRVCMTCHGLIESPDFDFTTYKAKISHRQRPPAVAEAEAGRPPEGNVPAHP